MSGVLPVSLQDFLHGCQPEVRKIMELTNNFECKRRMGLSAFYDISGGFLK